MLNKILVIVDNAELIDSLKKEDINSFVYPLEGYSIGFNNYFKMSNIKEDNSYLYINRILNCQEIDNLKIIIKELPSNIKGIIFNDLGLINILKESNIRKILLNDHINTNNLSIKEYLKYVSNVVISSDITIEEIKDIVDMNKNTSINIFGYQSISYSRRLLLSNFNDNYQVNINKKVNINDQNNDFLVIENDYGTVFYDNKIFNGLELLNIDLEYYIINSFNISNDNIIKVINSIKNKKDLLSEYPNKEFLYEKTIYKLVERN